MFDLALLAVATLLGALVNGACYLGSVLYLGRGNANFLFTLLGLAIAARYGHLLPDAMPALAAAPRALVIAGLIAFVVLLALATRTLLAPAAAPARGADSARGTWATAIGIGACAGLLYALHPNWSYGSLIESAAGAGHAMRDALLAAALLFIGATAGALVRHRWQFKAPSALRAARCLAGGVLMGLGAHLVPGGNDMLLLWAIPGLAAYGVVAYGLMVATLATAMAIASAVRRPQST